MDEVSGDTIDRLDPVVLRLDEIVMDCTEPDRLAAFWAQLLDYEIIDSGPDLAAIEDPADNGPSICFQHVPEGKLSKNRVHFDLSVDEDSLEGAVTRLTALGATQIDVGQGPDRTWVVLADPEGNEFCLVP